jgi:hypothetical protein
VFEKRVLRRIFGPKRVEVAGGWRKLHNEELHSLYSSPSTIRMIKSRRMRWAGHGKILKFIAQRSLCMCSREVRQRGISGFYCRKIPVLCNSHVNPI